MFVAERLGGNIFWQILFMRKCEKRAQSFSFIETSADVLRAE